ncbi:MAG: DMT family transporter [Phycisphaerae bacterium]|jgi:drug/metabolite transporter (DMT)-like permease|nr:DMT family transporter [Phycisphaerae bacterium]
MTTEHSSGFAIWRIGLLLGGVWACATAIIFIRLSTTPPMLLTGLRLLGASIVLSPLCVRDFRKHRGKLGWGDLRMTMIAGAAMGLHFTSWIMGARLANPTNASLIVNMVPAVLPLMLFVMVRERVTRGELKATGLVMAGVCILGAWDFHVSAENFTGDAICFGSMLIFCLYLTLGRRNRHFATIWLYVVPLYFFGGCLALAMGVFIELGVLGAPMSWSVREILLIAALTIIPTVMGHSILNYSVKHMRGQLVGIINLFQFVFVGVMAWCVGEKTPAWTIVPAAALVLGGAIIAVKSQKPVAPDVLE